MIYRYIDYGYRLHGGIFILLFVLENVCLSDVNPHASETLTSHAT